MRNWQMHHMEEIIGMLCYIYGSCYQLWIELSGWKGSVTYGLGADLSLPHCLSVTTGIWTLTHKSDLRAEISGSIVRYDALAPRPEVLLPWDFVCACAVSLELKYHIPGKNIRVGWSKYHMLLIHSIMPVKFIMCIYHTVHCSCKTVLLNPILAATIAHVCGPVYAVSCLYRVLWSIRVVFIILRSFMLLFWKKSGHLYLERNSRLGLHLYNFTRLVLVFS